MTIHVSTLRLATLRQLVPAGKNLRFGVNILNVLTIRITSVFINHEQEQEQDQEQDHDQEDTFLNMVTEFSYPVSTSFILINSYENRCSKE